MTSRKENGYDTVLATRLRQVIDKKRLKQTDIAASAGVSRQAISGYADGSIVPKADTLAKIAKYLEVSTDYLLGLSDTENENSERIEDKKLVMCADAIALIDKLLKETIKANFTIQSGIVGHVNDDKEIDFDGVVDDSSIVFDDDHIEIRIYDKGLLHYYREIDKMRGFFPSAPQVVKEYEERIKRDLINEYGSIMLQEIEKVSVTSLSKYGATEKSPIDSSDLPF